MADIFTINQNNASLGDRLNPTGMDDSMYLSGNMFMPIKVQNQEFMYVPKSFADKGATYNDGKMYAWSPVLLIPDIEKTFIPVNVDKQFIDNAFKDIPQEIVKTNPNVTQVENNTEGYLIPRSTFDAALDVLPPDRLGLKQNGLGVQFVSDLQGIPTQKTVVNGTPVYSNSSGTTVVTAGRDAINFTPPKESFLRSIGLGGITDAIQDLGPLGQIGLAVATGGLSIPEQLAAQTLYNAAGGASFEDALKGAALSVALTEGVKASGLLGGKTQSNLAPEIDGDLIPFDEGLTGIDIGDVIPATPAQLEGLYPVGGVFNPPVDTTGIDIGETIPFTPEQVEGLYPPQNVFLPEGIDVGETIPATPEQLEGLYPPNDIFTPMEGIDMGDTIPATEEQLAGLYPENNTFLPEGIDVGDTIPYTQEQIAGLYPPGDIFNPPIDTTGIDTGDVIPFTPEQVEGLYPPGDTFLPGGYTGTEGIDTGDVIPTTPAQLEGLYPPSNTFVPPPTLPSIKDIANAAVIAGTINSIVNPPSLDVGGSGGGFAVVPVPSEWRAPTYSQSFTPFDINSLFTTQNLLGGTQWQNLPPEIQFAVAPTMQALTDMISNGQTTTRN